MVRHRLGWLLLAAACAPSFFTACGGSENGGGAGAPGTGGAATGTGGSATGGGTATGGATGTGGTATPQPDGGSVACGDAGVCPNPMGNPQNTRFCDLPNNRCVECFTNADCVGDPQGTVCNTVQGRCRPCVAGSTVPTEGCPAGQVCVPGNNNNGACVIVCTTDAQCAADMNNPVCDTVASRCVECNTNAECAANMGNPVCVTATHTCQECLTNADCAADVNNPICDTTSNSCEQCIADTDCTPYPGRPFCRMQNQNCVQCRTLADCPAGATACPANGGQAGTCQFPPDGGGAPDATPPAPDVSLPVPDAARPADAASGG
jgi:hypothetical protein